MRHTESVIFLNKRVSDPINDFLIFLVSIPRKVPRRDTFYKLKPCSELYVEYHLSRDEREKDARIHATQCTVR